MKGVTEPETVLPDADAPFTARSFTPSQMFQFARVRAGFGDSGPSKSTVQVFEPLVSVADTGSGAGLSCCKKVELGSVAQPRIIFCDPRLNPEPVV